MIPITAYSRKFKLIIKLQGDHFEEMRQFPFSARTLLQPVGAEWRQSS